MTTNTNLLDRRELLKGGAVLLLAATTSIDARAQSGGGPVHLNAWVSVGPTDQFTLALAHAEMGQGITTTLPAILADELDIDFGRVRLVNADFNLAYRHPVYQWQFTGNSESIATYANLVRAAGAAARFMLLQAAAVRTKISVDRPLPGRGTRQGRFSHARYVRACWSEIPGPERGIPIQVQ